MALQLLHCLAALAPLQRVPNQSCAATAQTGALWLCHASLRVRGMVQSADRPATFCLRVSTCKYSYIIHYRYTSLLAWNRFVLGSAWFDANSRAKERVNDKLNCLADVL